MNRREALAALVAMPTVTKIAAVPANSDDVIVVECPGPISEAVAAHIKKHLLDIWPNRRIVVLGDNIRIKLVALLLVLLVGVSSAFAQIRPGPTANTGIIFWDQKADSLATAQQYTFAYYIDQNPTAIVITPATCTDVGNNQLYACSGPLSTLAAGTHDYILETRCSFCTPTTTKALPLTYSNTGSNGLVAATGIRAESPSGANIPPLASIVDSQGATWTQSATPPAACPPSVVGHPATDCLSQMRNGVVLGLGSETFYSNAAIYVRGPQGSEMHWWKYNGPNSWTDLGTVKPTGR